MHLKPSARLQRFLGNELISDPNLALLEFVKNAYDAGAANVLIKFALAPADPSLTIADDGSGMNEDLFRFHWLRPGFSAKSLDFNDALPPGPISPIVEARRLGRRPAGEKGLGRLAAGRLGRVLTVWTRTSATEQWLKVVFDWATFNDMTKALDQVALPFSYEDHAPPEAFDTGTAVVIEGIDRRSWIGRIPGRPAAGRPRTRLGRLKQDLSFLIRGSGHDEDFSIALDSDIVSASSDIGQIDARSAQEDSARFTYDFSFRAHSISPVAGFENVIEVEVVRLLKRDATAQESGRPATEEIASELRQIPLHEWPGPFVGTFQYTPPPAAKRAQEIDLRGAGVLLYRDDVLVEPYGLAGNDWLGVEARKASRQGHAPIQPASLSGEVLISRDNNPQLIDTSSRSGLIDSAVSGAFISLVRSEFASFETLLYQEVLVEGNWQGSAAEKKAKQANLAEQVSQLRLRSLAHRAGQPLQALGFDLVGLQSFSRRLNLPEEMRDTLDSYVGSIESHLDRLARIVEELNSNPDLSPTDIDVRVLVSEVLNELEGGALQKRSAIEVVGVPTASAVAPRVLVFESLYEVLMNALEAVDPLGDAGRVRVVLSDYRSEGVKISVTDNGGGFVDADGSPIDLERLTSTKGRPADGLRSAYNSAIASNAALYVASSGMDGTTVNLLLSSNSRPVRLINEL